MRIHTLYVNIENKFPNNLSRISTVRYESVEPAINRLSPSMIRGAANASAVIRLAVESRWIRCGVLRIVYCFGRRRRSRHNPRPPATGLRRGRGGGWKPTNGRRGTPAQITMLIVVVELSAHIPGSLLPPPPGANSCSSVR